MQNQSDGKESGGPIDAGTQTRASGNDEKLAQALRRNLQRRKQAESASGKSSSDKIG